MDCYKYAERGIFESASVEELPNEVRHSALQRVIQILKYQRDAYYSKLTNGDEIKPISALITTMATRIASKYEKKDCSVFELLEYVLNRLEMCIHQTEMTFEQYSLRYDDSPVLSYKNGKWNVPNPADPDDNLANKWNEDDRIPKSFFKWVSLSKWMENIVEPYYYSYEYYSRFGEFPYGDRGHDLVGVMETYQQIFKESDCAKVYKLLRAISQRKYKGHLLCPCESGMITRKCHGRLIYPFISDDYLFSIAKRDYSRLCEAIREYDKQSNH